MIPIMIQPKTKIVATIGPACRGPNVLDRLLAAGVDALRFNLSHGTTSDNNSDLALIRAACEQRCAPPATIADLCGPKVRTTQIDPERASVEPGDTCRIVRSLEQGDAARFGANYDGLIEDVQVGHRVLIDDGLVRMLVTEKEPDTLVCTVTQGGAIGNHKGINVPDSDLALPPLTEKDRVDVAWAVENEFDFVALSFVRRAEDVATLRAELDRLGATIPIIAKIETPQAIDALDEIIEASDAILVARGDLGVEMDASQIPMLQKKMIRRCRVAGKPVIVATQMLHSMVHSPSPTRAEVSDVANAVLDGADAVMLSAESSIGKFPVEAVAMMAQIARDANEFRLEDIGHGSAGAADGSPCRTHPPFRGGATVLGFAQHRTASAVARSVVVIAADLGAKLIVVWSRTGRTVRVLSKYQLPQPIVALASDPALCRRLSLGHGVSAMLVDKAHEDGSAPWSGVEERIVSEFELSPGEAIIIIGDPRATDRESTISIHLIAPPTA